MEFNCEINNDYLFADVLVELLEKGKRVSFAARGTSMYPTLKDGDILHIEPVSPKDIHKRDIILYTENDGVVVHRLVSIRRKPGNITFFTRGDSSSGSREISSIQILGRLFSFERQGKDISLNNSLSYFLYIKLRCFFVRIFRKLPFGIHHKFVVVKRAIVT